MIVQYHPLTATDLNSAVSYYNRQRPALGDEFRSEIYATSTEFDLILISSRPSNTASAVALYAGFLIRCCFVLLATTQSEF